MTHSHQQHTRRARAPHQVTRFSTSLAVACIICTLAPHRSYAQTARTTANQGSPAQYGWQDPDGYADGHNHMSLLATDNQTVPADSRIYNLVGDPIPDGNLPAYNNNYTLTFTLSASTPTMPPNNNSTITAFLTTEYSTNGGGSWFSVGGTSQVQASRSTPGITTTVQTFTVTLTLSGGAPVWIRLILRGTASGTLSGGAVSVYPYTSQGAPYPVTWSNIPGTPVVDASPYNFDKQDYSRCASACFAATNAQSTVPYFTLDAPRSVTLAYNGDRVNPRAFVHVNVRPDPYYAGTPTEYQLQVKVNAALVTFVNNEQTLHFAYPGDTARVQLAGEFNDSTYATGVYPMNILVSALYGSTLITRDVVTSLVAVNETNSPVARGWTLPGIQKLYLQGDGSALITEGDGSAVYFKKQGSIFVPPAGEFSSLAAVGTTWVRSFPDSTKVTFDANGKMTSAKDRFSNQTTITFDASNRVWKITDPMSRIITLTYGSNGLSTIQDPGGRTTNVAVNASKSLTAITDADNISTSFGYDTRGRLRTITDRGQHVTTIGYDSASGKLDSIISPQVPVYQQGNVSPITVLQSWQKIGVPYGATTPAVAAPKADTVKATVKEPGGGVSRFTINHWGSPVQVTDVLGRSTTVTYDARGLAIRTLYPTGALDSAVYNASGLPTFVQLGDSTNRRRIRYAGWAQPDSATGGPQRALRAYIGVNGRADSVRLGSSKTKYRYDTKGRVDSIIVVDSMIAPQGYLVRKTWFSAITGNVIKDSVPGGLVTALYEDTFGRDTAVSQPSSPLRRAHFDLLNRPTQNYDGVYTPPTTTVYDSVGNAVSVTDEKGQVYRFAYNALGWLVRRTDPAGQGDTVQYSLDGDLVRAVNRRGQAIALSYDALHRDTSKTGTNTDIDRWSYSTNGLIVTATSPITTETSYFNVHGQPDSVVTLMAGQTFWRRYHYTSVGMLDSVAVSGGGIAFRSRKYVIDTTQFTVASIRLGTTTAGSTSLAYNKSLQMTSITLRGGAHVARQYDRLSSVASISSATVPLQDSTGRMVSYDVLGRLTLDIGKDGTGGSKFTYDALGHVTSDSTVINPNPPPSDCDGYPPPIVGDQGSNCLQSQTWNAISGAQFSYDSVGNRRDQGGTYNIGNRITALGGCTYGPADLDGNMTSRTCQGQTVTFKWRAESYLDTVVVGTQTITYFYDAVGRLVRKDINGAPQAYYLWDGSNFLAELNASATGEIAEYSYYPGLDDPHAIVFGGVQYDMHTDPVAGVVALTDSTASLQRTYFYDAWGNLTDGQDNLPFNGADRARWKGALWLGSEANLYYMRSRWYEPQSGRFLSEDPIGLAAGVNLYSYASNDPINFADPTGTCRHYEVWNGTTDNPFQQEVAAGCDDDGAGYLAEAILRGGAQARRGRRGSSGQETGSQQCSSAPSRSVHGAGLVIDAGGVYSPIPGFGVAASGQAGGGIFWGNGGLRAGSYAGGGAFAGGPVSGGPGRGSGPANVVVGKGVNVTVGGFITNARGASELGGAFDTWQLAVGGWNIQFATGGGVWILSASKWGFSTPGITFTRYQTTTPLMLGGAGC